MTWVAVLLPFAFVVVSDARVETDRRIDVRRIGRSRRRRAVAEVPDPARDRAVGGVGELHGQWCHAAGRRRGEGRIRRSVDHVEHEHRVLHRIVRRPEVVTVRDEQLTVDELDRAGVQDPERTEVDVPTRHQRQRRGVDEDQSLRPRHRDDVLAVGRVGHAGDVPRHRARDRGRCAERVRRVVVAGDDAAVGEVQAHARTPAGAGRVGPLGEGLVRLDLEPTARVALQAVDRRVVGRLRRVRRARAAVARELVQHVVRRVVRDRLEVVRAGQPGRAPHATRRERVRNSSRCSARRTVLAVASTSNTRSPLSSDSHSASSDGTYAEPSRSNARIAGLVPEKVDVVKNRLRSQPRRRRQRQRADGPGAVRDQELGGVRAFRLENPTWSVLPLVRVKPKLPAPVTVDVTSNSIH